MELLILCQDPGEVIYKIIVKVVSREVNISKAVIVLDRLQKHLNRNRFESILTEIKFDKSFVELDRVTKGYNILEVQETKLKTETSDVILRVSKTVAKVEHSIVC